MLRHVIALSQVKYSAKYTSPALIVEHIAELGDKVTALHISNQFDTVDDMYWRALGIPMSDDAELDAGAFERNAKDKQKRAEIGLIAWTKRMAKHRQQNQPEANVA